MDMVPDFDLWSAGSHVPVPSTCKNLPKLTHISSLYRAGYQVANNNP